MSRIVLLSREFERRLDNLATLEEEVNGIFLYMLQQIPQEYRLFGVLSLFTLQKEYCPLEALFMTGVGDELHVQASPERIEIANEFFKRNPAYQLVKFHTHSRGTLRKYGSHYASHFSGDDITTYKKRLEEDQDFIGMVATPEMKLLYGRDNPKLRIVEDFPSEAERRITEELSDIARSKGYDLSRFKSGHRL